MSNYYSNDDFDDLDAIIRELLEQAGIGQWKGPGSFGFRIIISGDMPGKIRTPDDQRISEPAAEVYEIQDEVMVVAEIPGATREDIHLTLTGGLLTIDAEGGGRVVKSRVELPPVDPASMQYTCKNSVLEVTFKKTEAKNLE